MEATRVLHVDRQYATLLAAHVLHVDRQYATLLAARVLHVDRQYATLLPALQEMMSLLNEGSSADPPCAKMINLEALGLQEVMLLILKE